MPLLLYHVICVCMCYSLSCCSVWRMTKTQPSPWSSVCSSATRRLSVGCTSAANRELSTQWSTTWRRRTTLPSTTSSGSAQAASKVLILSATQLTTDITEVTQCQSDSNYMIQNCAWYSELQRDRWQWNYTVFRHSNFLSYLHELFVDLYKNCTVYTQGLVDSDNVKIRYSLRSMT